MKSLPPQVSEREAAMHRLITPTARIVSAMAILITGLGIATVFWKMPTGNANHALYPKEMIDKDLSGTPLPNEAIALISPEERAQISLPMLDIAPATDSGTGAYTQLYEAPPLLAGRSLEQGQAAFPTAGREEPVLPPKFEPMRSITEEKPIALEPVNRDFQPKPTSVSTTEKSDEMISLFLFAENSQASFDGTIEPSPPVDPFPTASAPMVSTQMPALQPLKPVHFDSLSPLLPLQPSTLRSL